MKNLIYIFIFALIQLSCSEQAARKMIYKSQADAMSHSAYRSGISIKQIKKQNRVRKSLLPQTLYKALNNESNSLRILHEMYASDCIGCTSDIIQFANDDTIFQVEIDLSNQKIKNLQTYPIDSVILQPQFEQINEIYQLIQDGGDWKSNPLIYGINHCNDGANHIMTVIENENNIQSIHVYCWMNEASRKWIKENKN